MLILNNRGAGLFILLLMIGMIGLFAAGAIASKSAHLNTVGQITIKQIKRKQLKSEIEVVFGNPELCSNMVHMSGSSFSMVGLNIGSSSISAGRSGAKIIAMSVHNQTTLVDGSKNAEFRIETDDGQYSLAHVHYSESAGAITNCNLIVDAQAACENMGAVWLDSQARCNICEQLGGSWSSGRCAM